MDSDAYDDNTAGDFGMCLGGKVKDLTILTLTVPRQVDTLVEHTDISSLCGEKPQQHLRPI